jgi:riboflavin synthase
LIPYTRDNTVLGTKEPGETVNIETDIIAKYVERLIAFTGEKAIKN